MSEIFSLYLNSVAGANPYIQIPTSTLAQRNYAIDWDIFFNGANFKYKKCKVRYEFYSDPAVGTVNQYDPSTYNSVLGLTGIPTKAITKYGAVVVGMLHLDTITTITASTSLTQTCLMGSNVIGPGISIGMPTGQTNLGVGIYGNVNNPLTLVSTSLLTNWAVILHFELYDPID